MFRKRQIRDIKNSFATNFNEKNSENYEINSSFKEEFVLQILSKFIRKFTKKSVTVAKSSGICSGSSEIARFRALPQTTHS